MNRKSNINSVLRLKHNQDSNSKPELECHSVLFSHVAPSLLSRDCKRYDDIIIEKDRPTFELRFFRHINMIYEKNKKILRYVTYNEIEISYCQDLKNTKK